MKNADVKNAYDTVIANTASCSDEVPVYIRVGQVGKSIFYDLNNNNQQVIKISKKCCNRSIKERKCRYEESC